MKKAVAISALLLYLAATTGVVVNSHFCGGKWKDIALFSDAKPCCKNCPHCENKSFQIHVNDFHFFSRVTPDLDAQHFLALWATVPAVLLPSSSTMEIVDYLLYKPPLLFRNIPLFTLSLLN